MVWYSMPAGHILSEVSGTSDTADGSWIMEVRIQWQRRVFLMKEGKNEREKEIGIIQQMSYGPSNSICFQSIIPFQFSIFKYSFSVMMWVRLHCTGTPFSHRLPLYGAIFRLELCMHGEDLVQKLHIISLYTSGLNMGKDVCFIQSCVWFTYAQFWPWT